VTNNEPELEIADLARRIEDADRPSAPIEKRLRLQWNVPYGTTPYIPLWFALAFLAFIVALVVAGILGVL
jgi:hypothetical protein